MYVVSYSFIVEKSVTVCQYIFYLGTTYDYKLNNLPLVLHFVSLLNEMKKNLKKKTKYFYVFDVVPDAFGIKVFDKVMHKMCALSPSLNCDF